MSDDTKTHTVSVSLSLPLESLATVQARMACVVEFGGLGKALEVAESDIIVRAPQWLPKIFLPAFAAAVIIVVFMQLIIPTIMAFKGMSSGYNIELCPEIEIRGVKISNCVRLTKPPAEQSGP